MVILLRLIKTKQKNPILIMQYFNWKYESWTSNSVVKQCNGVW